MDKIEILQLGKDYKTFKYRKKFASAIFFIEGDGEIKYL